MNKDKIDRLYLLGEKSSKKFREVSDYIVKHYVHDSIDGPALTTGDRVLISECTSIDMAVGAELKKNEYIITGIVLGVIITSVAIFVNNKIKERD